MMCQSSRGKAKIWAIFRQNGKKSGLFFGGGGNWTKSCLIVVSVSVLCGEALFI